MVRKAIEYLLPDDIRNIIITRFLYQAKFDNHSRYYPYRVTRNTNNVRFKFILIGDAGVGKTTFSYTYLYNEWKDKPSFEITNPPTFRIKETSYDNLKIGITLWKPRGQERFGAVIPIF